MFDIIVETVMGFVTNPIFVKYGLIGLFLNGVVSSITPFPTEVTTTALILSGEDQFIIFSTLSVASIIGGYLGYYIGYGGNSLLRQLFYKNPENISKKGRELFKLHGWVAILLSSWIP